MFESILQICMNFFAGVEDILGIKNIFYFFKNSDNTLTEHFFKIRTADQAVVMLGRD